MALNSYFQSMDIMYDRFGYYIYWGVSCWVPAIYTSTSQYMVMHPYNFEPITAVAIFLFGIFNVWANYDADRQRQHFRAMNGNVRIWGKPAKYIKAEYQTSDGKVHSIDTYFR